LIIEPPIVAGVNFATDPGAIVESDVNQAATTRGDVSAPIVASKSQEPSDNDIAYLRAAIEDGSRLPNTSEGMNAQVTRRALIVRSPYYCQFPLVR
jgi:hypothetical protein